MLDLAATGLGYVDPHTIQQFAAAARTTFPPAADYFVPRCVRACVLREGCEMEIHS